MSFITKSRNKKTTQEHNFTDDGFTYEAPLTYSEEIEILKDRVSCAYDNLDNVVDPLLIDSWIYELNAAQLRYQFCLQQLKNPGKEKTGVV